jgi:hypothetical protein
MRRTSQMSVPMPWIMIQTKPLGHMQCGKQLSNQDFSQQRRYACVVAA